ncbi:MAG: hypothetical protein N2558_02185 [Patescibacteria group bacterium]|nr:hypothetical protein [Patescibacteria group bacterium]
MLLRISGRISGKITKYVDCLETEYFLFASYIFSDEIYSRLKVEIAIATPLERLKPIGFVFGTRYYDESDVFGSFKEV